jgi:ATP-dependent protease Clp ATPase subunit
MPVAQLAPVRSNMLNRMMEYAEATIGKTLLAKTLARVLDVPFSVSDATSFTQVRASY